MSGQHRKPGPAKGSQKVPNSGGSRKGCPNKNTKALKDMILAALDGVGGVEYLQEQARSNPGPFLTLIGKVLPLQVTGENGGPVEASVTLVVKGVKPR